MWIENVSAADISKGFHYNAGENSMLISIVDPASFRPAPQYKFKEIHNFEFLDVEEADEVDDRRYGVVMGRLRSLYGYYSMQKIIV